MDGLKKYSQVSFEQQMKTRQLSTSFSKFVKGKMSSILNSNHKIISHAQQNNYSVITSESTDINRRRVKFIDEIEKNYPLVDIIEIQSYKEYNNEGTIIISETSDMNCQCSLS